MVDFEQSSSDTRIRTNDVHVNELNALDNLYNVSCKLFRHSNLQFNTIYIALTLKLNY